MKKKSKNKKTLGKFCPLSNVWELYKDFLVVDVLKDFCRLGNVLLKRQELSFGASKATRQIILRHSKQNTSVFVIIVCNMWNSVIIQFDVFPSDTLAAYCYYGYLLRLTLFLFYDFC